MTHHPYRYRVNDMDGSGMGSWLSTLKNRFLGKDTSPSAEAQAQEIADYYIERDKAAAAAGVSLPTDVGNGLTTQSALMIGGGLLAAAMLLGRKHK